MQDGQPDAPVGLSYAHLEDLLKQTHDLAKENHKILKRMERNALIGFIAKVIIWLIVLGVPIFLLSTYFEPIMRGLSHTGTASSSRLLGLPSAEQLQKAIEAYKAQK
ncbi:MAG: hypothetical protein JWO84_235 [Parcubacteria group bacterium]|nr:hypothetical protein [Parcubacteria group bacterium]